MFKRKILLHSWRWKVSIGDLYAKYDVYIYGRVFFIQSLIHRDGAFKADVIVPYIKDPVTCEADRCNTMLSALEKSYRAEVETYAYEMERRWNRSRRRGLWK